MSAEAFPRVRPAVEPANGANGARVREPAALTASRADIDRLESLRGKGERLLIPIRNNKSQMVILSSFYKKTKFEIYL